MRQYTAKKILFVTSDTDSVGSYTELLQALPEQPMTVLFVPDLAEAVEQLEQHEPDAILLDSDVENEDNIQQIGRIYSMGGHIPIVLLVNEDSPAALNTLELGVQDYLPKHQCSGGLLVRTVLKAIIRRRREDELHRDNVTLRSQQGALKDALERLETAHRELKLTQRRLAETEKVESIARLTAGVAHEVKNPLQIMRSGMDLLRMQIREPSKVLTVALEQMEDAISRANSIIMELLDFARPRELEATVQELNPIIDKCLLLVRNELNRHHIRLVKQLDPRLAPLRLNKNKIGQALINIFLNAAQAMKSQGGGELVVVSRMTQVQVNDKTRNFKEVPEGQGESAVIVEIKDTGKGIDDNVIAKVFEPFFSTKSEGEGTGLGLSVTKKIIQLHGGEIYLSNREDTKGVVVTLLFRDFYPDLTILDVYADDDIKDKTDVSDLPVATVVE